MFTECIGFSLSYESSEVRLMILAAKTLAAFCCRGVFDWNWIFYNLHQAGNNVIAMVELPLAHKFTMFRTVPLM